MFSLSGIFTYAGSGDDLYQSFVTSVNYQPNSIFSVQLSLPYVWNSGEDKTAFMEYKAHGIGDARITAWTDLSEWFIFPAVPEEKKEEEIPEELLEDPFAELPGIPVVPEEEGKEAGKSDTYPHFRFGLGLKFATGDHDVRDSASSLLPARFQPGWGVTSPVVGVGYRQSFGSLRVVATLMYEISGGENSVDYKHGDILRFDSSAYYPLYEKYSLIGGVGYSLTWIPREDRLAGAKMRDTDGTFHSVAVTGVVTVYGGLSAALMVRIPFGSSGSGSVNDVDFQYTLSLTYSF